MMKYFVRAAVSVLVMACCAFSMHALDKSFYAESSKLATGKWVKIAVTASGIYQITADDVRSWGLGSDLSQIHVFGYGGAPLSEKMNADNYADDLPQMPVVRTADRILFYAQGPITWKRLNSRFDQVQVQHPYAISGSYFVTNDSRFTDIEPVKADKEPVGPVVTSYLERLYHEQEIVNPGEMGRVFLGESFLSNKSQTFKFTLDNLLQGSEVKVITMFGAKCDAASSTLTYSYNNTPLPALSDDLIFVTTSSDFYETTSSTSVKTFTLDGTNDLNYTVTYSCPGTPKLARLDYITVNYGRELALRNGSLCFGLQD
ncbi:MAG: hypothetical protein IIZ44_02440, partial [Muribaculaceae bacterium]|nr:hypothetical protein [Muribaculaceae bacterium]